MSAPGRTYRGEITDHATWGEGERHVFFVEVDGEAGRALLAEIGVGRRRIPVAIALGRAAELLPELIADAVTEERA